jgi:hypothetical protein
MNDMSKRINLRELEILKKVRQNTSVDKKHLSELMENCFKFISEYKSALFRRE